ncbi:flagellar filament capping protein FliD [Pseudomonas umsongensis]|uniref:flagellar filament capping protein FliD n=2 Tax=Pseudomonas umsongensis TaxID=198618 RepID=UPI0012455EA5|nr:flagellar filament capping protein FliD [Pseudomonas umsongensis]QFG28697.1 flagellar filament capping protein FliD [Pseudomonas umsongensis]
MASSTVSGVGSGIDTQAIVKALVEAEKAPKQAQIDKQTTSASTTLSGISVIKAALDTYRAALAKLNNASSFNGLSVSSTDEKIAKASIDATATNGSYALSVSQLATSSKVTSAVFAGGASSIVNSGTEPTTLTISQSGADYNISIPAGATLKETREAINDQLKSKGITANVLSGTDGARLVISSDSTGAGTDITLSGADELSKNVTATAGQNAKYTLDGVAFDSKSNTVTSALSGVTLSLIAKGDSTVTVANDTSMLKTSAQSFISAYNAMMAAINTQTKVTATTTTDGASTTAGALTGDATMRGLVSSIRNELMGGTKSAANGLSSLSQLGITTDKTTGLLALDDKTWDKAAKTYGTGMASLFTGTDGLLSRMTAATDSYAVKGGVLESRQNILTGTLTSLSAEKESLDRRIATLQTTLTAKYTAMDTLVAQLNATSKSIMTTLNALNKTSDD